MPALSLLIKPASSSCNMCCEYCFYSDVANRREISNYGMISDETMEIIIKKAFAYADSMVSFGFQGGEPTLAGLEFYRRVIDWQKKYNQKRIQVGNAIQTNGLNINEEWAKFLHDNHFLVGLSLDGTKAIHDKYRKDAKKEGTFDRVLNAARIMTEYQVEFNILSTVNRDVAKNIEKIYYFFKKQGFQYLQFIPCLDELESGERREYSLTAADYGDFLKRLFKLWYVDINTNHPMSIRYFDNLVMMAGGYPPESCGMAGSCSCYYMIEADGSVYPCDFYVTDEWRIGNIVTNGWEEMSSTSTAKKFVEISRQVAEECRKCPYFGICRGGCRRNREPISIGENRLNELCPAFREFFSYALEDIIKAAKKFLSSPKRRG